jgi:hypothetical protein
MYADELLKPWLEPLRTEVPEIELFDCHTLPPSPGWDLTAAAALVARTPDAPLPEGR